MADVKKYKEMYGSPIIEDVFGGIVAEIEEAEKKIEQLKQDILNYQFKIHSIEGDRDHYKNLSDMPISNDKFKGEYNLLKERIKMRIKDILDSSNHEDGNYLSTLFNILFCLNKK